MASNCSSEPTLLHTLRAACTLLFVIGLVMAANGLQGSLLRVSAEAVSFEPTAIGRLFDRLGRLKVMTIVAILSPVASLVATSIMAIDSMYSIVLITVTGGFSLSNHSLSLACYLASELSESVAVSDWS